jgi:crotonobetainyl-CoA:carnitine CoA-transferase CaiB-like acyl-CoA transferase
VRDPHLRARGVFARAHDAEHGEFEQVGAVLAGGAREVPVHEVRDAEATDTAELLAGAGMGAAEIEALRSAGAIE